MVCPRAPRGVLARVGPGRGIPAGGPHRARNPSRSCVDRWEGWL